MMLILHRRRDSTKPNVANAFNGAACAFNNKSAAAHRSGSSALRCRRRGSVEAT
jgi:hypothetical protein